MHLRFCFVCFISMATAQRAPAIDVPGPFPPRIIETFDDYPPSFDLKTVYPLANSANPNGAIVTDSSLYNGIEGSAAEFDPVTTMNGALHRIHIDELSILDPAIFGPLIFRADIYDDGITEFKRVHVDARFQPTVGGSQNIIQMGMRPFPGGQFGHAQLGFPGSPSIWKGFRLPEEMDERVEIGPGWHRFSVMISMTELVYQLDLHRDGTVDAVDIEPVFLLPVGFNEVRFGKLGFHPEPALVAFDNIRLAAIPEPAAATLTVAGSLLMAAKLRRRAAMRT